ncbi:MAG: DoxX family membrane protein [Myxococcales bacterium]|nr:DoxX family membrane protein [Myxococcales bacterium]
MSFDLDPAVRIALRLSLALLLLAASHHKLREFEAFRSAMANYRLLPDRWTRVAAAGVASGELAVGIALLAPGLTRAAAGAAVALLALYTAAIAINLIRGRRDIDCGCAGPRARRPLSGGLVARNAVLMLVAAACALPAAGRPLVWLDGVTLVAGVTVLVFLYGAIDASLAHAPRLRALGGSKA